MITINCVGCGKNLKIGPELAGKKVRCPSCETVLRIPGGAKDTASAPIISNWYYIQETLFGEKEVGPCSDTRFLDLVSSRKLKPQTLIRSPEVTNNQWVNFGQFDINIVRNAVNHRFEQARLEQQKRAEAARVAKENARRLRAYIKEAVSDGRLQKSEQRIIEDFASKAKISMAEVQEIVEQEAEVLLEDLINAAMEDGELSPDEETHLTATAKHFGLDLNKSENNRIWLEMGRICFLLNNCSADEYPVVEAPFSLQAREVCYATEDFEWMSVKTSRSKTSPGVRIDTLGDASVYLTSKRILFVGAIESKTARNTSISSIQRYRDGVLVVRNTSPSYFLKYKSQDHEAQGTALLLERLILPDTQKVRASIPMSCFLVPPSNEIIEADLIDDYPADEYHVGSGPRFTFRVVGTHVENRQAIANQLRLEEQLFLVREPTNPYDANAVAVLSKDQQHIGYLKREVAEWFGPKMDRGYSFVSSVFRKRDDGAIIAGVYET